MEGGRGGGKPAAQVCPSEHLSKLRFGKLLKWAQNWVLLHFPFLAGPPAFKMLQEEEEEEEEGGSVGDSGGTGRRQQEEGEAEETRSASTPTSTSIIEHCLVDWGSKRWVGRRT